MGEASHGHTAGHEVRLQGAAASEAALLTGDKINMKTKPMCANEICIFPEGYGDVYLKGWKYHENPPVALFLLFFLFIFFRV